MNIVLLSGGSGKRLWPLSNEANSKQFLRLFKNDKNEPESMVQRVYRQIRQAVPKAELLVSTNSLQVDSVRRQLGENVDMCVEPSRGNTFPAIILAAAYMKYKRQLDDSSPFIVLPIDVCADIGYFEILPEMEGKLSENNVVIMGVLPTFATEKYGYIRTKGETVASFKEKPNIKEAEDLIALGALWNCGVFAMRIKYILDIAQKYITINSYEDVLNQFTKIPVNSFDYQVLEHERSIGYVTYSGKWKDLGTWNTLCEEVTEYIKGENTIIGEGSENTHVLNMLDKPIIVLGVPNAVVVASYDGILVTDKHKSSFMKPYTEKLEGRAMYEQHEWGNYRVLDYVRSSNGSSLIKRVKVEAGKSISYQYHSKRAEILVIISGEGIVTIENAKQVIESGSVVTIPLGAKHKIAAATDIEFIEVQLGDEELEESDIVCEQSIIPT